MVSMYIARAKWPSKDGKKIHESVWLRESFREGGKVKTRNIANLKHCSPEEIAAIELALKHKDNLAVLGSADDIELKEGPSAGAVWTVYHAAKKLGITKALGPGFQGQLALWQVMARVLDQGSRLSAVRLARSCAADAILRFERGFCEDDLYKNLADLAENQEKIEKTLFKTRRPAEKPRLFLYDVTSSYLEGDQNELADWGYNRDKKRGKKQIVIGLLCDEYGDPVSTEVFEGNTTDLATFESQIQKAAERFGCRRVTFVGDRGMIKSGQIEDLQKSGFNYITAITKPQIRSLLKSGVFQLGLFDEKLGEVEQGGVRYILRKNPIRAEEMAQTRASKLETVQTLAETLNEYLAAHPKAEVHAAWRKVSEKEGRLGLSAFVTVRAEDRRIIVEVDEEELAEIALLDGCYALKTDLPKEAADKEIIHERYKDLAMVESAFRTCKTSHLEVRPVFVRREESTRGHVLVVMLAYLIVRWLQKAWADIDLTVEEALDHLKKLSAVEVSVKGGDACLRLPEPGDLSQKLMEKAGTALPKVLPRNKVNVSTRKKLPSRRKMS